MKRFETFARCMTLLACSGLIVPTAAFGESPVVPATNARVLDVSLQDGGLLLGQVVDAGGQTMQDVEVTIAGRGRELAKTKTDSLGRFAMKGLVGGSYQLATGGSQLAFRAWTKETAPPSSAAGALLVEGTTVRGQCGCKGDGSQSGYTHASYNGVASFNRTGYNGAASFNQGGYGHTYDAGVATSGDSGYVTTSGDTASVVVSGEPTVASPAHSGVVTSGDVGATYGSSAGYYDGSAVASAGTSYAGGGYGGGAVYGGYGAAGGAAGSAGGGLLGGGGILGGSGLLSSPWLLGAGVAAAVAVPVALDDDDAS